MTAVRSFCRSAASLLLATSVVTCSDGVSSPTRDSMRRASVAVEPHFSADALRALAVLSAAAGFDIEFDQVRLVIVRPPSDTLKDTTVVFAVDQESLTIPLTVVATPGEVVQARVEYRAGSVLLFTGQVSVTVSPPGGGSPVPPPTVEMVFVGPGVTATRVTLTPTGGTFSSSATPVTFAAQVFDAAGASLAGVPIAWSTSDAAIATISRSGVLQFTGTQGTVDVIAQPPSEVTGRATLTFVGPATQVVVVSGGAQTGEIRRLLEQPLVVEVRAANGTPLAGQPVTFASSNASVSPANATTNTAGRAQATVTLGRVAGTQQVVVQGPGAPVVVAMLAVAGAPARLRFDVQPTTVEATAPFAPAVALSVTDTADNVVTTATHAVTLALSGGPEGATLGGTTTRNAVQGTALFADLHIDVVGTGYALAAAAPALVSATSAPFSIAAQAPASVTISPAGGTLTALGETLPLTTAVRDARGNILPDATVSWTSRVPGLASVNAGGTVLAVANGASYIVAGAGTVRDSVLVIVAQAVDTLLLLPDTVVLAAVGDTLRLQATARDRNGNLVTNHTPAYTSSDEAVATVDAAGLVTLRGSGTATVTVTVGGKQASTFVRVGQTTVPIGTGFASLRVTPSPVSLRVGDTITFSAVLVNADGSTAPVTPLWATNAPNRASVDVSSGHAIALDTGAVRITATSGGVAGHAQVTVLPAPALRSLDFAPDTLTGTTTAARSTTVSVTAVDAGSGVASVQITLTAPAGGATRSCSASFPSVGTRASGTWRCTLTIPAGSATGDWHATSLSIVGTITRTYNESALSAYGTTTLTVNP